MNASFIIVRHNLVGARHGGASRSTAAEVRRPFGVEGLDAFLEVVGLAKATVAMAFQFKAFDRVESW
jgi:hypothetical protein